MEDEIILDISATGDGDQPKTPVNGSVAADDNANEQQPAELPPERQYCILRIGWERYCVSVMEIEEVVEWPKITPVPLAPKYLAGVFNLRGAIVPVVDIAPNQGRRFDSAMKRVVVGLVPTQEGHGLTRIGIAADAVIGTHTTVEPLTTENISADVPHCCGLLPVGDKQALVLDLRRLAECFPIPEI